MGERSSNTKDSIRSYPLEKYQKSKKHLENGGLSSSFSEGIFGDSGRRIFVVAGVMRMAPEKFLVADAISALFTIGLWGGVGYLGGNSLQVLKRDITRIEHIAIIVLVVLFACWVIYVYFKGNKKFEEGKKGDKIES